MAKQVPMTNTTTNTTRVVYADPFTDDSYVYTRPLLVGYGLTTGQAYATRAISALASNILTTPFHVVQTLAQVGAKEGQKNYADIIEDIWDKEGLSGFFRGALPGALRFIETAALNYVIYYFVKGALQDQTTGVLSESNHQIANATSIILSSFLSYPLEVIRTRLVVDYDHKTYPGLIECAQNTIENEGFGSLFSGAALSAIGNYAMIELMERVWTPIRVGLAITPPKLVDAVCQSLLIQTIYYPIDTVLKMIQAPKTYKRLHPDVPFDNSIEAATSTISKHGLFGLWRGYVVSALQVVPYITLVSLTYQGTANMFERLNIERAPVGAANFNTRVERLA